MTSVAPPTSVSRILRGASRVRMSGRDRQPCMPIAREQAIGGGGTDAAGGIVGEIVSGGARPGLEQTLHGAPGGLDRISPLEQGSVADETIVDPRLVTHRSHRFRKRRAVQVQ